MQEKPQLSREAIRFVRFIVSEMKPVKPGSGLKPSR